jgi:hypothetical protein
MTRARSTRVARTLSDLWVRASRRHAFRRTALPMASYYAVTLALPLANGAAQSGAFVEHALVVLVVPPVAIILACAVHTGAHALATACRAARAPRGSSELATAPPTAAKSSEQSERQAPK